MKKLLIALVLTSLSGCARNPVTGQREIVLISESQEIAIGRENHEPILAEFGQVESLEACDSINQNLQGNERLTLVRFVPSPATTAMVPNRTSAGGRTR